MSAVAAPPAPSQMGSAVPTSQGEIRASSLMPSTPPPANVPAERIAAAAPPKPAQAVKPPVSGNPDVKVFDDGKKPSDKLFANLRNLAKDPNAPDEPRGAKVPTESAKAAAKPGEEAELSGNPDEVLDEGVETVKPGEKPAEVIDKKKTNPWKLIDEHKKARAQLEAEVADLKKIVANPEVRKSELQKMAEFEKRNQELEETIKFVDYSKSKEFTEKYQKPYEAAWTRAMSELKELTVTDLTTGDERAMGPADLLDLVNMPLLKAREKADELYGAAANEVMAYRKEIRALYEQQNQALDAARKSGVEKHQQETAQRQAQMEQIQKDTHQYWEDQNKAILANETTGPYFKPVEGNEEINKRLDAGYKFVDETMALNPLNPNLTPEQRQDAIKRHAALRHRAAAFGRMRLQYETATKELAAVRARLAEFEKSVPTFGSDAAAGQSNAIPANGGRMSGLMQRLQAKAR